jgi:hypothetical protein
MAEEKTFFCEDCRELHEFPTVEGTKSFEDCSFCGKQSMCSDGTGLKLEPKEIEEEEVKHEKVTFARIVETPTHQLLLTLNHDTDNDIKYIKVESDYSHLALDIGVSRFGIDFAAGKGEDIQKIFDDFTPEDGEKLIKDTEVKIKEHVKQVKAMEQSRPAK